MTGNSLDDVTDQHPMGITKARIRLVNNTDLQMAQRGLVEADTVRWRELDAIADTGAITLVLPRCVVDALGIPIEDFVEATVADGRRVRLGRAHGVRIELLGRTTVVTAYVSEADAPVLLGAIPLEDLDLHVDPKTQSLMPNHPEGQLGILYSAVA